MRSIFSKPTKYTVLISTTILGAALLVGCGANHKQETTGQYFDSSVITTKVKTKLLADDYVKGLPITVETYKNAVQLSGFVDNNKQKERAVELAKSVAGVRDVEDSLVIKNN